MNAPETVVDLLQLPRMGTQLLRAVLTRKRAPADALPQVRLRVQGVRASPERLARYRELCGFEVDGALPPTYPQVLAGPLHATLLGRPDFPHPVMGLVHVRNHIRQERRLSEGEAYAMSAWFDARREVPAGIELDLTTELETGGRVVWQARTTMLRRVAKAREGERKPRGSEPDAFAASRPASWQVPGDTGRRYAAVSGDYNPIHVHALSARPFGFPRAIAHGMWTLARCVAELGETAQAQALTLDCEFRRPLLLPSQVTFQTLRRGDGVEFRVTSREGKPHLLGALEPAAAD